MSATYMTFMENDVRAIQVSVRDQFDTPYPLTAATYKILSAIKNHHGGDEIVSDTPAMVVDNTANILVNTMITSAAGDYDVIWTLSRTISPSGSTYTFHHKTRLKVEELQ